MTRAVTFLHAADLHLDSPFKGLSDIHDEIFDDIRMSTFHAFDRLVDAAIENEVDFVLLVGDLFDNERQSLKAQLHLRDGFERLKNERINVYISYGNHDFLSGNHHPIEFPDNVFVFPSEEVAAFTFEKEGEKLANIYGFSYEKRGVTENKAKQFAVRDPSVPFHIAMLHGMVHGAKDHDPYAPFRLDDLLNEPFHYWALGHVHKRQILSEEPPVIYPGNIQGRHRKETGEKGCYIVEMDERKTRWRFVPLQSFVIVNERVDFTESGSIAEMLEALVHFMEKRADRPHLYALEFMIGRKQHERLGMDGRLDELVELVNEKFLRRGQWQYIYTYDLYVIDETNRKDDLLFLEQIREVMGEIDVFHEIKDLYNHTKARAYLELESERKLLEDAYNTLVDEFKKAR